MRHLTSTWPSRRNSNLFDELERMMSEFNQNSSASNISSFGGSFEPACDICEDENHYLLTIDVPGIKKEDIKIEMAQNVLTISGERHSSNRSNDDKQTQKFERSHGSFTRTFSLPSSVDADKIEAHCDNGVLNIYLPKSELAHSRKIEIQSKSGGFFDKLTSRHKSEDTTKSSSTPSSPH